MENKSLAAQIMSTENTGQIKSWRDELEVVGSYDKQGNYNVKIEKTVQNIMVMLQKRPDFAGKIQYDEFMNRVIYGERTIRDEDVAFIRTEVEKELQFYNRDKTYDAISNIAMENKFHPVKDYLDNLKWDGKKRVENIFTTLLDADDDELTHLMTKLWFIAAVKRVYEPGCKFDSMILLSGEHGIGKSVACRKLSKGRYCEFSTDELRTEGHKKDLYDKLGGVWIANGDEMKLTQKTMEAVKSLISAEKFKYRKAYGHFDSEFPIHCVFIGSTNEEEMLKDYSTLTERRFWVIKCHKKTIDSRVGDILTDEYVDQLWAEAVQMYKENINTPLYIADRKMQIEFAEKQKQYKTFNNNPVVDYVRDILEREYSLNQFHAFDTPQAFLAQVVDPIMYGGKKEKLTKLPVSYLKFVLNKVYNESYSVNLIRQAFAGEWEVKNIEWKNSNGEKTVCRGLKRFESDLRRKTLEFEGDESN